MAKPYRIAVILEIESTDPMFQEDRFNTMHVTAEGVEALRRAVLRALPGGVKRVVAVTGPQLMKAMLETHEMAMEITGLGPMIARPPEDYEPPDGR
jgi:hypothetical protein